MQSKADIRDSGEAITASWILLIAAFSAGGSFIFACAMPFAALATIAATRMRFADGAALIGLAWLTSQAVGYFFLGYPWTPSSFGWGIAIGMAALAALLAAHAIVRFTSGWKGVALGLCAAFAAYECTLLTATTVLPSGPGAFAWKVVLQIFAVNVIATIVLLAVHAVSDRIGFAPRQPAFKPA
jgi:hypothetical protein